MKYIMLKGVIALFAGLIPIKAEADELRLTQEMRLAANKLDKNAAVTDCRYYRKLTQLVTCKINASQNLALDSIDGLDGWKLTECRRLRFWVFFAGRYECYYEKPGKTLTLGRDLDGMYYGSIEKK